MKYKSDELLYTGNWVELRLRDGWYEYLKHKGNGGVVVVIYDPAKRKFLCRYENCPVHGVDSVSLDPTSLTGTVDPGYTPEEIAVKEVEEESGYVIHEEQLVDCGYTFPSKASDTVMYMFYVELPHAADDEKHYGHGDGTEGEKGAYCKWLPIEELEELHYGIITHTLLRAGVLGFIK